MRYLGLVLDGKWNFHAHFALLSPKLLRVAAALGGLLPNLKGPDVSCRRLYEGIVRSMALYGAPAWADSLTRQDIILLRRPQRMMAVRVARAYRTVSYDAACVLSGILPWDLDARALSSVFYWREEARRASGLEMAPQEVERRRSLLRKRAVDSWARRLADAESGHWTVQAVLPVLTQWLERRHGYLSFRMTQVLTGHGCFGKYLCRIGREPNAACHHCSCPEDTAQHTLEACPAWEEERGAVCAVVGDDLSLPSVARAMVGSENAWTAVLTFCDIVMSRKESAERDRERDNPARRRRRRRGGRVMR